MGRRAKPKKSEAEAKRSVARKSPKADAPRIQELEARLADALEERAALSEILRVISQSPTDAQPVFDTIVAHALRLCDAPASGVYRFDGELIHVVALRNIDPAGVDAVRQAYPRPPTRGGATGRAILTRNVVYIRDVGEDPEYQLHSTAAAVGYRSIMSVPMLRGHNAIGAITVNAGDVAAFSDNHVTLLQAFADQAVIAIENVRLFKEREVRNRDLTEALEQQTATAEILRVISTSPTNLQPVLDAVVKSATRFCGAHDAELYRLHGTDLTVAAHHGPISAPMGRLIPVVRGTVAGRAVLERRAVHVADLLAEPEEFPVGYALAREFEFRTVVSVPLLREGKPVGTINLRRTDVRPFTDASIALLQTFADQAVIAIENVRLFTELEARNQDLTESLERQTATAEILSVISASPTDLRPVFDAILQSALRLCRAVNGGIWRLETGVLSPVAFAGSRSPEWDALAQGIEPIPPRREMVSGWAVLEGQVLSVPDIEADDRFPNAQRLARTMGIRSVLGVPMLREGVAVGSMVLNKMEPAGFDERQIDLVRTFADQAVIAIENVRLFTELEARNRDLSATSQILQVISRSPTDEKPVFDSIVRSTIRLCDATFCVAYRYDGEQLHVVAHDNLTPETLALLDARYPQPPSRETATGISTLERRVVHIPDASADDLPPGSREFARQQGWGSLLAVPLLRDGQPVGSIAVARIERKPFTEQQVALVQTFADQAVIAIENVRLFTELQASNRELTTALDTQTATSDILRVISRSQTDVQPVFDAIVASAVRLLRGHSGVLTRVARDQIELAALTSTDEATDAAWRARFPRPLHAVGMHAQAIGDRAPLIIADSETDSRVSEPARAVARRQGFRSWVVVPLLRQEEAIGTISVNRLEVGAFTDDEIGLLQTFADQAVIAIENARLLSELRARTQELTRSVEQLTALGDVGRAVSSSLDLDTVLTTIVGRAVHLSGTDGGTIFEYDEGAEEFSPRATLNADESQSALLRATRLRRGEGAVGQMAVTREPLQIPDIAAEGAYDSRLRGALLEAGTRAVLAIPLLHEERIVGGLVVTRRTPGAFTTEIVEILRTFATQSALAIENARLFREIERKSRELEVASQHKSEFLANMSHELRTPLNAIIGYSELLEEEAGDLDGGRLVPDLQKIATAAKHQLSLINDILDLSKIEAGRMELELADFHLPSAVENALILVRERASRRGIALGHTIDSGLGMVRADERKVKQVLLNLLSNALKFTPEGGRVDVRAGLRDDLAEISVADTGVGIAPEDQEAVFEEFRQVGTAAKKVEGTGLGLALSRKFVELHGGRIWVRSQVGEGSTFTFTLPVRREEMGA